MNRQQLVEKINDLWIEHYACLDISKEGFFFGNDRKTVFEEYKAGKVFSQSIPNYFVGSLLTAKFLTIQLNTGINKNILQNNTIKQIEEQKIEEQDFQENGVFSHERVIEKFWEYDYLYYKLLFLTDEEINEFKNSTENHLVLDNIAKVKKIFNEITKIETESEACCKYKELLKILKEIHKSWEEGKNKENIEYAIMDAYIREIFLPILNLKFPFSVNFVPQPVRLLFDKYYINAGRGGLNCWKVEFKGKKISDYLEYKVKNNLNELVFREIAHPELRKRVKYLSDIALLQLFPYRTRESKDFTGNVRFKKNFEKSLKFALDVIKNINEYNELVSNQKEKILVNITRTGTLKDILKKNEYKNILNKDWIYTQKSPLTTHHTPKCMILYKNKIDQ